MKDVVLRKWSLSVSCCMSNDTLRARSQEKEIIPVGIVLSMDWDRTNASNENVASELTHPAVICCGVG